MSGIKLFVCCAIVISAKLACAPAVPVSPLLLESSRVVDRVIAESPDAERIEAAKGRLMAFLKALSQERCDLAFEMLSTGYKTRAINAAGGAEAALESFCAGNCLRDETLFSCDWKRVMAGSEPFFVTTPPPEVSVEQFPGSKLFFVVQRDGGYVTFLLVQDGPLASLEPIL